MTIPRRPFEAPSAPSGPWVPPVPPGPEGTSELPSTHVPVPGAFEPLPATPGMERPITAREQYARRIAQPALEQGLERPAPWHNGDPVLAAIERHVDAQIHDRHTGRVQGPFPSLNVGNLKYHLRRDATLGEQGIKVSRGEIRRALGEMAARTLVTRRSFYNYEIAPETFRSYDRRIHQHPDFED